MEEKTSNNNVLSQCITYFDVNANKAQHPTAKLCI